MRPVSGRDDTRSCVSIYLRAAVLVLMTVLGVVLIGWWWTQRTRGWLLPILVLAPLLLPLPGLLRGNRYTYAWSTLLTIGYIALGLTEVIANPQQRVFPAAVLFTGFAWLVALIGFLRVTRAPQE